MAVQHAAFAFREMIVVFSRREFGKHVEDAAGDAAIHRRAAIKHFVNRGGNRFLG
jgi:hypothetical protein